MQSYSEAIKMNVDDIDKNSIKYINPFLPIDEDKLLELYEDNFDME